MKKLVLLMVMQMLCLNVKAQYIETFDSNSLEWTECAYKNAVGTAVIDKGVMTVKSKGDMKALGATISVLAAANGQKAETAATALRENTFFETHCYAPIDVQKPFVITSKVNIKQLAEDRLVGLVFNYRDGGNFYCFSFNNSFVKFVRYENNEVVGEVMQGLRTKKKFRTDMVWVLESDGSQLTFKVDDAPIMKIRYMPLQYSGFGYYTYGNQELVVDEVEFNQ